MILSFIKLKIRVRWISLKRLSNGYKFFYDDSGYYSKNVIVCLIIAMARCFDYKVNIQDNLNEIFDVHPVLRTVTEGEL